MKTVSKLIIQIDDSALMGFPVGISRDFELAFWSSEVNDLVVNVKLPPELSVLVPDLSTLISIFYNKYHDCINDRLIDSNM